MVKDHPNRQFRGKHLLLKGKTFQQYGYGCYTSHLAWELHKGARHLIWLQRHSEDGEPYHHGVVLQGLLIKRNKTFTWRPDSCKREQSLHLSAYWCVFPLQNREICKKLFVGQSNKDFFMHALVEALSQLKKCRNFWQFWLSQPFLWLLHLLAAGKSGPLCDMFLTYAPIPGANSLNSSLWYLIQTNISHRAQALGLICHTEVPCEFWDLSQGHRGFLLVSRDLLQ